ncbi:MAG: pilus assembly protein PilP [Methylococcales symbiont of Hymedesmia sp. n. MRB-2018]|nr:MAG: pilus assembly protein PilP [Methylococcales symbiont of Hymedesmia sp. n. MRB-2018]
MIQNLTQVFFCLFVFNLAGCASSDVSDLERYISGVKAKPKGTIKPLPAIKIVEPFIFNPEGVRDPFSQVERLEETGELEGVGVNTGIRPDKSRRKEELESYSLDTLRMVGTLTLNKVSWALVKTGDGIIHRVQKGNYMGRNDGEISDITDNKIELMEIVPDKPGAWRKQQVSIALAE